MMNIITTTNQLAIAANTVSATIDELSRHIQLVGETFKKMGITFKDATGKFRNFGDVYQETYDALKNDTYDVQKSAELIGPVTIGKIENPNEKDVFDFLEQNVYDHIEEVFNPDI